MVFQIIAILFLVVCLFLGNWQPAAAQPQSRTIGLAISDQVDQAGLPAHLRAQHSLRVDDLREQMRAILVGMGRFQVLNWEAIPAEDRYTYKGSEAVDLVVHVLLHRADKIFRNQVIYFNETLGFSPGYKGAQEGAINYEVIALPAISQRLEIRLINLRKNNKILWSVMGDSTAIVPYDGRTFLFNPRKYPGLTHPYLIRDYLADLLRLQQDNRAVDRILEVADRWFMSRPGDDLQTAQDLLAGLTGSFSEELDRNLPLEGKIGALLPPQEGEQRVLLNIGARHGVVPQLRLEVWRPLPADQKVGQVEVVKADSTTSVARLRRLEKQLRQRGEGLQLLDRVISLRRPILNPGTDDAFSSRGKPHL